MAFKEVFAANGFGGRFLSTFKLSGKIVGNFETEVALEKGYILNPCGRVDIEVRHGWSCRHKLLEWLWDYCFWLSNFVAQVEVGKRPFGQHGVM